MDLNGQFKFKHDSGRVHKFFAKLKKIEQKLFSKKYHDSLLAKSFIPVENPNTISVKKDSLSPVVKQKSIVFGWHPYWNDENYQDYNYNLLTHVSYFACDIDIITGKLKDKQRWINTPIVNYAKTKNPQCKVLLTVTCFGELTTELFLHEETKQDNLIKELYDVIINKKADGVCLDFEGLTANDENLYMVFIQKLKTQFKNGKLLVYVTLPAIEPSKSSLNYKELNGSVDGYIIMGYDYFGGFSKEFDGPIAPLNKSSNWITQSVITSVDNYLSKIPDSLLILGVPYFGGIWEVNSLGVPGTPINFLGYRTYSSSQQYINSNKFYNDTLIGSSYYSFETKEETFRHYWMETEYSMGAKFDYVISKKLKGIAIFALSFDYGSNTYWNLINNKFFGGVQNIIPVDSISLKNPKNTSESDSKSEKVQKPSTISSVISIIKSKPYLTGITVTFIFISILMVLITVIVNKDNVIKLKSNKMLYLFYFSTIIFALIVVGAIGFFGFKGFFLWYLTLIAFFSIFVFLLVHYMKSNKQPMP